MAWVQPEAVRLDRPLAADEFAGCPALEGAQSAGAVAGEQERLRGCLNLPARCSGRSEPSHAQLAGELDAVVCQHDMNAAGDRLDEDAQHPSGDWSCRLGTEVGIGGLRRPVDRDMEEQLAVLATHLGNVDVEEVDWIALEAPPLALGAVIPGRPRSAAQTVEPYCSSSLCRLDRVKLGICGWNANSTPSSGGRICLWDARRSLPP